MITFGSRAVAVVTVGGDRVASGAQAATGVLVAIAVRSFIAVGIGVAGRVGLAVLTAGFRLQMQIF